MEIPDECKKALGVWNKCTEQYTLDDSSPHTFTVKNTTVKPWSKQEYNDRLATFQSHLWFGKPSAVSREECASKGWNCVDSSQIYCKFCGNELTFQFRKENETGQLVDMSLAEENELALIYHRKLSDGHDEFCPWRTEKCSKAVVNGKIAALNMIQHTQHQKTFEHIQERLDSFLDI